METTGTSINISDLRNKYGIHRLDPRFSDTTKNNSFIDKLNDGLLQINSWEKIKTIAKECYDEVVSDNQGNVADYIPQLKNSDPNIFNVCITSVDGQVLILGEENTKFCVQSCSKPVTYGIALENYSEEEVHNFVGKEPSGRNFNELCLNQDNLPHNPLINAGAIMTASLIKKDDPQSKRFDYILQFWKNLVANGSISFNNSVYLSEKDTADRNFCLAYMMQESGSFINGKDINISKSIERNWNLTDLQKTLELYFQLCSIETNILGGGLIAATFANGGVNPWTEKQIFTYANTKKILSLMHSCGMYDYSGEWSYKIGVPAKSGVAGLIYGVIPGIMGIATYSAKLDDVGNSYRGIQFFTKFSKRINMHVFDNSHCNNKVIIRNTDIFNKRLLGYLYLDSVFKNDYSGINHSLAKGCDINFVDYDKRSALHIAYAEKNKDMIKFLEDKGIDTELKDRWGNTARNEVK